MNLPAPLWRATALAVVAHAVLLMWMRGHGGAATVSQRPAALMVTQVLVSEGKHRQAALSNAKLAGEGATAVPTHAGAGTARDDAAADATSGPVMVESGMDQALAAVSQGDQSGPANQLAGLSESYRPAEDLDRSPRLLGDWPLDEHALPADPGQRPEHLHVTLRLWVSAQGHVDAVQVLDAQPAVPWLDGLLRNLDQTSLQPAVDQGHPVATAWSVELDLDLKAGL